MENATNIDGDLLEKDRNSIKNDLEEKVGIVRSPVADFNRNESSSNGDSPVEVPNSQSENTLPICNIYNNTFSAKSSLTRHKMIHTGGRPFVCGVCPASFYRKCALEVHERIHTGERPFVCEKCGASFRCKATLVSHEIIHTGEKQYYCGKCSKSFSQSSSMRTHESKCRNDQ